MKIQTRLLLFTSALVVVTALIVGGVGYKIGADAARARVQRHLTHTRDQKAQELKKEFEGIGSGLRTLAELTAARNTLPNLAKDLKSLKKEVVAVKVNSRMHSEVARYHSPMLQPDILRVIPKLTDVSVYLQSRYIREAREKDVPVREIVTFRDKPSAPYFKGTAFVQPLLLDFAQQYHLEDLALVDTKGQVLYTVEKGLNYATDLTSGIFASAPISNAYRWSLSASPRSFQVFDLAPQSTFINKKSAWVAVPVYDGSQLIGSLIAQVSEARIQEIIGSGENAQILFVRNEASLPQKTNLQASTRVTLPGVDWLLVTQPADVPGRSFERFAAKGLIILVPLLALLLLIAYWFTRRFVSPLHELNEGLRSYAHGKIRIDYKGKDEFAQVVENLNKFLNEYEEVCNAKKLASDTLEKYRGILMVVDSEHRIATISNGTAELLGVPPTSLRGTELKLWLDLDGKSLDPNNPHQAAVLRSISGQTYPLEISNSLIADPQDAEKMLTVIAGVDVSALKNLTHDLEIKEQLFRESQTTSHMGSYRWDLATNNIVWSDQEYKIFGLDPHTIKLNRDIFRSLILPEDLPLLDRATQEVRKGDANPLSIDIRFRKADTQEIIWVRCMARTEYDDYGNATYVYGTNQDITEIKRAEQSLIAARNEALKSSQAKSEFLARMSHEIRTPMNAIMGMADLLKETKLSEDQEYFVTIFVKAGEVLMALINDILDLSKIEAGEVSIENIPFDLQKLLSDIQDIMRPRAREKGLEYSFEISPQVNPHLLGDPTKIRQVLINLIGNSLKFTERGSIRVVIGRNPSKKDHLLISVNDTGLGIPPAKQHLIFQKFSQADSSITRRYGGTGLGLAISKSLVELMGGQIWFKSRESVGTSFFITIPYHEQITHPVTHKPLPMQAGKLDFAPKEQRDPNRKVRILLADDTEDNRILFTRFLSREPFEIVEAENGLEALDKIKSEKFDIIFMDVQMPELDGYAATAQIREWEASHNQAHTPIIALTAHALSEDRMKSINAGCDDHITKPFKKNTILSVIEKYS